MKQLYFKSIILAILSFVSITVSAYDCKVDGFYYNLNQTDNTASVTYQNLSIRYYGSNMIVSYSSDYTGIVTIPSSFTFDGITYTVTSIGDHAFESCSDLTSVFISNSITIIGEGAFKNCSGLTSITIPNSVTTIVDFCFLWL